MRVLTPTEVEPFLSDPVVRQRHLELDLPPTEDWARQSMPTDAGRKNAFAALVARLLYEDPGDVVLEIGEWGIWPSSDNPELFHDYRRCLGEQRHVSEARFHVFTADESVAFRNLLNLCLIFIYDVKVHKLKSGDRVYVSHDEYVDFNFVDREKQDFVEKWLDK